MKYKVLGKKIGTFTSDKGENICYGRLHLSYIDSEIDGTAVEVAKCKPDLIIDVNPGDDVNIDRDSKGRILDVTVVY